MLRTILSVFANYHGFSQTRKLVEFFPKVFYLRPYLSSCPITWIEFQWERIAIDIQTTHRIKLFIETIVCYMYTCLNCVCVKFLQFNTWCKLVSNSVITFFYKLGKINKVHIVLNSTNTVWVFQVMEPLEYILIE